MKDKKCIDVFFFRLQKEGKSVPEVILRMVSGNKKNTGSFQGRKPRKSGQTTMS